MTDETTDIQTKGLSYALRLIGQSRSISDLNRSVLLGIIYEVQITLAKAMSDDNDTIADPEFMYALRNVVLEQQSRRKGEALKTGKTFAAPSL